MNQTNTPSILGRLRAVVPQRTDLTFDEALRIAELQAAKLTQLLDIHARDLNEHHIADLPRVLVTYEDLPVSGMSHWNGQTWVISLAKYDSPARQRFTLLHEFKHILDHGSVHRLYQDTSRHTRAQLAEVAADYFAGCVLVPKRDLKAVWGRGMQRVGALSDYFGVSTKAIAVRLDQTKLNAPFDRRPAEARCARPVRSYSQTQRFRAMRPAYSARSY